MARTRSISSAYYTPSSRHLICVVQTIIIDLARSLVWHGVLRLWRQHCPDVIRVSALVQCRLYDEQWAVDWSDCRTNRTEWDRTAPILRRGRISRAGIVLENDRGGGGAEGGVPPPRTSHWSRSCHHDQLRFHRFPTLYRQSIPVRSQVFMAM